MPFKHYIRRIEGKDTYTNLPPHGIGWMVTYRRNDKEDGQRRYGVVVRVESDRSIWATFADSEVESLGLGYRDRKLLSHSRYKTFEWLYYVGVPEDAV